MRYIKVAQTDDVKDGEKKKIMMADKVLLLTNIQGEYFVINNRCPHMGGSLYDGNLKGNQIICPKHGTAFDVRTGKVSVNGKLLFIKLKVGDVQSYPVKIEGSDILIGVDL